MKKIAFALVSVLLLVSCNSKKANTEESIDGELPKIEEMQAQGHNARNSLSYHGVYDGVLPCADCPGIKVQLTLNMDETFVYEQEYLTGKEEKDSTLMSSYSGKIFWDKEGFNIKLEGLEGKAPSLYFVKEAALEVLNVDGSRIDSNLSEHYTLKQTSILEE